MQNCFLSLNRTLTKNEQALVWKKLDSHIESDAEKRVYEEIVRNWNHDEMKITTILLEGDAGSGKTQIAKALSAKFNLPYTKITCFSDMDKSDILGSILPVITDNKKNKIEYQYYPSEIVRAYENGWLLEIQEPTVIRDAGVLMALNSVLELDGSLNLANRIVHRHPDFIVIITTNRGYNGCRPLNEALRDRVQHVEKLDLPPKAVMIKRVKAKTGYHFEKVLDYLAEIIILLDKTAKANGFKGVAGMRSYFYLVDSIASGTSIEQSLYYKALYKITTDSQELKILEQALIGSGILEELKKIENKDIINNSKITDFNLINKQEYFNEKKELDFSLQKLNNIEYKNKTNSENNTDISSNDNAQNGKPSYHEFDSLNKEKTEKKEFRKQLNFQARESVKGSMHENIKLIVHCFEVTELNKMEYNDIITNLLPVINELIFKSKPLLEYEMTNEVSKSHYYGTKFCADKIAANDFRLFARNKPPETNPSLAVALRIDESASMSAFKRLEAAKKAAIALYEFCNSCNIPIMIYGDSADHSKLEQMSIYAYVDFESKDKNDKYALMNIKARSNNRDGMAIRIIADKLIKTKQKTKLLISISDGAPKAMPDYTGEKAFCDMKDTLQEYRRKGINFLATSIGQDREAIREIYGAENTIDITDLKQLPTRLLQIIVRYL